MLTISGGCPRALGTDYLDNGHVTTSIADVTAKESQIRIADNSPSQRDCPTDHSGWSIYGYGSCDTGLMGLLTLGVLCSLLVTVE